MEEALQTVTFPTTLGIHTQTHTHAATENRQLVFIHYTLKVKEMQA